MVILGIKKSIFLLLNQSESLDPGSPPVPAFTTSNHVVEEVGLTPTEAVTPNDSPTDTPPIIVHSPIETTFTSALSSSETEPEATTTIELVASVATSSAAFQSAIIRSPSPAVATVATSPVAFQSAINTPSHGSSPPLVSSSSTSSDSVRMLKEASLVAILLH